MLRKDKQEYIALPLSIQTITLVGSFQVPCQCCSVGPPPFGLSPGLLFSRKYLSQCPPFVNVVPLGQCSLVNSICPPP